MKDQYGNVIPEELEGLVDMFKSMIIDSDLEKFNFSMSTKLGITYDVVWHHGLQKEHSQIEITITQKVRVNHG